MTNFEGCYLTDKGLALCTKLGTNNINFTRAVTGAGLYTNVSEVKSLTRLKDQKQEFELTSFEVKEDYTVDVLFYIRNTDLVESYQLREIGLYAEDSSGTEVLYCVAVALKDSMTEPIPAYDGTLDYTAKINVDTIVSSDAKVSISFNEQDHEWTAAYVKSIAGEVNVGVDGTLQEQINDLKETTDGRLETIEGDIEDLQETDTAEKAKVQTLQKQSNYVYQGVSLNTKFATEIAKFSDVWAWIKDRISKNNVYDLNVGDYIEWTLNSETIKSQIAGINTYRRTTDQELGYHIDFISKDCYSQTVQWNTTANNNGTSADPCPYTASNLYKFLNEDLYAKLPTGLKNVIKNKRTLMEQRYSSSGALTDSTGWSWKDIGALWVPTEYEVFGAQVWSTKGWAAGQAVQYPIFANSFENIIKGSGDGGSRCHWWLASAYSGNSANACKVNSGGGADYYYASLASRVPVCFRIAA